MRLKVVSDVSVLIVVEGWREMEFRGERERYH